MHVRTANPTDPSPKIATVDPVSTFAVLQAAPTPKTQIEERLLLCERATFDELTWWAHLFFKLWVFNSNIQAFKLTKSITVPVDIPQLRRHAGFGGTEGSIFVTWAMAWDIWKMISNLPFEVSESAGLISWHPCKEISWKGVLNISCSFLICNLHILHNLRRKKGWYIVSPSVTSSTSSPTLSTTLQHIKFVGTNTRSHNLNAWKLEHWISANNMMDLFHLMLLHNR